MSFKSGSLQSDLKVLTKFLKSETGNSVGLINSSFLHFCDVPWSCKIHLLRHPGDLFRNNFWAFPGEGGGHRPSSCQSCCLGWDPKLEAPFVISMHVVVYFMAPEVS